MIVQSRLIGSLTHKADVSSRANSLIVIPYGASPLNPLDSSSTDELGVMCTYGYGATRRLAASTLQSDETVEPTPSPFSSSVELLDANEWLLRLDYFAKSDPDGPFQARFEQVRKMLIELLPDVGDIRIRKPERSASAARDGLNNFVLFKTPYGEVPLRELSLGYQAMLAWLVDFASRMFERYPDSENPLAEPAVVLVDEIDLHLHPVWQQKVVDFLTKSFLRTQFIVTAHSPLVVQVAEDANIILLRRDGDHVVVENRPEVIHEWRVDQVLTSDLFGLPSGRSPRVTALMNERTELLAAGITTDEQKQRLAEIDRELGVLPAAENLHCAIRRQAEYASMARALLRTFEA